MVMSPLKVVQLLIASKSLWELTVIDDEQVSLLLLAAARG
jgi:hypothetical protein